MDPGVWGIPGGAIPQGKKAPLEAFEAALREAREEVGRLPEVPTSSGSYVWRAPDSDFTFTTFVVHLSKTFIPKLNWESDDGVWVTPAEIDTGEVQGIEVHPAFLDAWNASLRAIAFPGLPQAEPERCPCDHGPLPPEVLHRMIARPQAIHTPATEEALRRVPTIKRLTAAGSVVADRIPGGQIGRAHV